MAKTESSKGKCPGMRGKKAAKKPQVVKKHGGTKAPGKPKPTPKPKPKPPSRVPENNSIQEFWAATIRSDAIHISFKGGGRDGVKVLRNGVPKKWRDVTEGICCTYFVRDKVHYLAMVSAAKLAKMQGTLGTGRDAVLMTSHAKTLRWGLEQVGTKGGVKYRKVDACYGFWFDVSNAGGERSKCVHTNRRPEAEINISCCDLDGGYGGASPRVRLQWWLVLQDWVQSSLETAVTLVTCHQSRAD